MIIHGGYLVDQIPMQRQLRSVFFSYKTFLHSVDFQARCHVIVSLACLVNGALSRLEILSFQVFLLCTFLYSALASNWHSGSFLASLTFSKRSWFCQIRSSTCLLSEVISVPILHECASMAMRCSRLLFLRARLVRPRGPRSEGQPQ